MGIIAFASQRIPLAQEKTHIDRTLEDDELELKIDLLPGEDGIHQLEGILGLALDFPFVRGQTRREMHVVLYTAGAPDHHEIIYRYDSKQPHIKHKQRGTVVTTPGGLPLLLRREGHSKPQTRDAGRWEFLQELAALQVRHPCIGGFEKQSVDLEMVAGNAVFALSVSAMRDVRDGEELAQAEIEYAGHKQNSRAPSTADIYALFDRFAEKMGPALRTHVSTRSKLTWLLEKKDTAAVS